MDMGEITSFRKQKGESETLNLFFAKSYQSNGSWSVAGDMQHEVLVSYYKKVRQGFSEGRV